MHRHNFYIRSFFTEIIQSTLELANFFASEGAEAEPMTPQQFGDMMRRETARWTKVAREANISIE